VNITLPRHELREAVQGIGKVVSGKSTLPALGCVRFDAGKNVVAQATNLDEVVEYRFDGAKVGGPGACIVPVSVLKDLAKGSKAESVEIKQESPVHLALINHVAGHAVRQVVDAMELDEWPAPPAGVPTERAPGFIETYQRLVPFSSTDPTRHVINSVFVEVGQGPTPVTMVATDGRRLTSCNSMVLPVSESVILPMTKFLCWNKLPTGIEIGVHDDKGQHWFGVHAGAFRYAVKTVEGTYPNFRQVIPSAQGEHVITFADDDATLLGQVLATLPGGEEITLVGADERVTLYARGPGDPQWTTLTLEDTRYTGDRAFVGVNRAYLRDALKAGFREFTLTDELTPIVSRDGHGGTHVLMPMRVEDPQESAQTESTDTEEPAVETEQGNALEPSSKPVAQKGRNKVTNENKPQNEPTTLDSVQTACQEAKAKVKEAGQALTRLSQAVKAFEREQKLKEKEIDQAKAAIRKVQSLTLAA